MMKKILYLFIASLFVFGAETQARNLTKNHVRNVPEFKMKNFEGTKTLTRKDILGDVALVNFFASWCTPCKAEHPMLMSLSKRGIPIYGINMRDKKANVVSWFAKDGNPYKIVLRDQSGRQMVKWGLYGLPETFVIDKKGVIHYRIAGPLTPKVINEDILPLIETLRKR